MNINDWYEVEVLVSGNVVLLFKNYYSDHYEWSDNGDIDHLIGLHNYKKLLDMMGLGLKDLLASRRIRTEKIIRSQLGKNYLTLLGRMPPYRLMGGIMGLDMAIRRVSLLEKRLVMLKEFIGETQYDEFFLINNQL